jgi:hypothetical protein
MRDGVVLTRQEARAAFNHRHLCAETAEHLGELQPDVAAADDNEMARKVLQGDDPDVGHVGDLVEARHGRGRGAAADVQKHLLACDDAVADRERLWGDEAGVAAY